ncbi:MAG: leucine-rich repeat domain-containing protein [Planctomycetota bacterium]
MVTITDSKPESAESEPKPVYLLVDEPVGSVEEDILNLRPFAEVIAGAALGTEGPFTIGVYADWGEGKTSVMRLARELIEKTNERRKNDENHREIITVWFNAWQYGKEEHPIVPLVATIEKAVNNKLKAMSDDEHKITLRTGLSKMAEALKAIACGFSAKVGLGNLGISLDVNKILKVYEELQKSADKLLKKTLYYDAFEKLETIVKEIDNETGAPKIAVFIDDLDRCNPPEAIKLLESIKLVLSQKGFIFALTLDKRILQGFLKFRYEEEFKVEGYETSGKDYLDKIIQLPLPLVPHETEFKEYIRRLLLKKNGALSKESNRPVRKVIDSLQDVLSKGARFNPRNLVRFVNNLIVDRLIWRSRRHSEAASEEEDIEVMGLCVVSRILRDHFKDDRLYEYLWRHQDACDRVQGFFEEPELAGKKVGDQPSDVEKIIEKLEKMEFLKDVLRTDPGDLWLKDSDQRNAVNQFIVEQRDEEDADAKLRDEDKVLDHEIRRLVNVEKGAISDKLLSNVTELHLSNKGLKTLPAGLFELADLKTLSLHSNRLTTVPDAIRELSRLQELYLHRNLLEAVPDSIGKLIYLRTLDLSDNKLKAVPDAITKLTSLQSLFLYGNELSGVPDSIGKLTSLRRLCLHDNELKAVPDAIGKLTTLQTLYLHSNKLSSVPDSIGKLPVLQELSLGGNELTTVPEVIGKLARLRRLHLADNQLTAVPDEIGRLSSLQTLNLSGNELTSVPESVGNLSSLEKLYLNGNELTTIPESFGNLSSLKVLNLEGNPFTDEEKSKVKGLLPNCNIRF